MVGVKAEFSGLSETLAKLHRIESQTARGKILRAAANKAARPLLKAARSLVSVEDGWLKKSLGMRIKSYRHSGTVVAMVGPRSGPSKKKKKGPRRSRRLKFLRSVFRLAVRLFAAKAAKVKKPTHYAHLVEFGHGGPSPAPAHPFLRPAWDAHHNNAAATIAAEIEAGIAAIK
jgi:HK97 gp10 family phage protein